MLKNPDVDLSADLLRALEEVCVPTATHHLVRRGFHNTFLIGIPPQALQPGQTMVGRARTLRFLPKREDLVAAQYGTVAGRPHRIAIESIEPGQVLVVDAGGSLEAGVAGAVEVADEERADDPGRRHGEARHRQRRLCRARKPGGQAQQSRAGACDPTDPPGFGISGPRLRPYRPTPAAHRPI